jgi:hypothetical protein
MQKEQGMPPLPVNVSVSNCRFLEVWNFEGYRTERQFEAVRKIVAQKDFDFSCASKLFQREGSQYKGRFSFIYYDKQGKLNFVSIRPNGEIHETHKV